MPRRREIAKREIPADPIYNSPLVTKFISTIMKDGKRSTAERIMYQALEIVKEKTSDDPVKVFKKAIENVKPSLEVTEFFAGYGTPSSAQSLSQYRHHGPHRCRQDDHD